MKKILFAIISFTVFFACSPGDSSEKNTLEEISNNGLLYSINDFVKSGFKPNKHYDVTNLPSALKVVYGFWKTPNKVPADYEIRIYSSHEDAVNIGVKYAKERSGETALLDESQASWKEGLKESRFCSGPTRSGGGVNCGLPKYNNFYVYSNTIILCQGRNVEESSINCEFLINSFK